MNFRRKRPRPWDSLVDDPLTPMMIGRLLGANEMAIALLSLEDESPRAKIVAQVLRGPSAYFVEDLTEGPKKRDDPPAAKGVGS